jgi:hypothetical protein
MTIFEKDENFVAFETVLREAMARSGMRLLSYCVMSNHFRMACERGRMPDATWEAYQRGTPDRSNPLRMAVVRFPEITGRRKPELLESVRKRFPLLLLVSMRSIWTSCDCFPAVAHDRMWG